MTTCNRIYVEYKSTYNLVQVHIFSYLWKVLVVFVHNLLIRCYYKYSSLSLLRCLIIRNAADLLIMIPDHYLNHYKAVEIYTGYFDGLDIMILFPYPSSIAITSDYCTYIKHLSTHLCGTKK